MKEKVKLPPNPGGLIEGLRDTGYDVNTALADIVDNSIDAAAEVINVDFKMDQGGEVTVIISDDGVGMDKNALLEGMTYGGKGNRDPKRLGKFGLGMKTASTAFCRRLVVISRSNQADNIVKGVWDLDHVVKVGDWELLLEDPEDHEVEVFKDAESNGTGTIVIWENVDRLLRSYADPAGKPARKALEAIGEVFAEHVGKVFQRFLDIEDDRARNIKIKVNGQEVFPWDPFCKDEPEAEVVAQEDTPVEYEEGEETHFHIKAVVLPRKEQFSSPESWKRAQVGTPTQGVYVYRENRLIHSGDWLGMSQNEPHMSLLRVEFSFDHKLDSGFDVDIKKSRINLDSALYDFISKSFLPAPRAAANERYRKGKKAAVTKESKGAHFDSNKNINSKEENVKGSKMSISDQELGEVELTNKQGTFKMKLKLSNNQSDSELNVLTAEQIDDGLLWEPTFVNGRYHAVRINTGHPYYSKVYVPNLSSGVTVQGMDSLLWALAEAENGTITASTKKHFKELRFEVSRILRTLVEDLPDPELDE